MSQAEPETFEFRGTSRFIVQRRLGAGSFGEVFEVLDLERDSAVALKRLHEVAPDAVSRFKREFRALADIGHPNLVSLYELIADAGEWFFTMELVRGRSFVEHVRTGPEAERFTRARMALRQLVHGLLALHAAGKLHRDIKPSNVLVTAEGRVKLLDFGLVAELSPHGTLGQAVGTPAFMSPEQAAGLPVTSSSDWYEVGGLLYEALTGRLPFAGESAEVLVSKQWFEPAAAHEVDHAVPEDLSRLCQDLLRREAGRRPEGHEILSRLAVAPAPVGFASQQRGTPFEGRRAELGTLREAYDAMRRGRATSVFIQGPAGIGKTALAKRFLASLLVRDDEPVVLAGRCFHQESVPYKAVDILVDALADHLRDLPAADAEQIVPKDALALVRLFPVLGTVDAVAAAERRVLEIPDPLELRRHAFAAFRGLLAGLAARGPLVLFIDDLQWGDRESAALLGELLRPPSPPPLLLLGCYRSEEERSPLLEVLRPTLALSGGFTELSLGELSLDEARNLVRRLLNPDDTVSKKTADAIALESGGNPFLLDELVRFARTSGERVGLARTSLPTMIRARVAELPGEAQRFVSLLALAGQPLPASVVRRAAEVELDELPLLAQLRAAHLVRIRARAGREQVEVTHSRVREALVSLLDPEETRDGHRRLALALEAEERSDPETLAIHFRAAGEVARARDFAVLAAEKAAETLAFDRSARLFRDALSLAPEADAERWSLTVRLADALSAAGRGPEAAETYLAAVPGATASQATELRRRAAEQLLRSGHVDEGLATLREVLVSLGWELAETPNRALASLLFQRARIKLRGLSFTERTATEIPHADLVRVDTCWSLAVGLSIVDNVRGADFQARHLLLALDAGEPYRVARALALEAGYRATAGGVAAGETRRLLELADDVARRVENPHATGLVTLTSGIAAALEGRWPAARRLLQGAESILRERCRGVAWELFNAQYFGLLSLFYLGELKGLSERLPVLLAEAEERGDLYAATSLSTRIAYPVHLAADRPDLAREGLAEAMRRWSSQGFHMQHMWRLFADVEIALYEEDGERAWRLVQEGWPRLAKSLLLRIELIRIGAFHRRARAAIAAAMTAKSPKEQASLLREAERSLRAIAGESARWGRPLVLLARAGIAAVRGDWAVSHDALAKAETGFEEVGMSLYVAVTRRRLLGSDPGAAAYLEAQQIRNPSRTTAMLAPGFPRNRTPDPDKEVP